MYASLLKIKAVQRIIKLKKADCLLVNALKNIRYLTGFTGSSALVLITRDKGIFLTDFRYKEQAEKELKGWEIIVEKGKRIPTLRRVAEKLGLRSLGFETSISYEFYGLLEKLPLSLVPCKKVVENLRKIKDDEEIKHIKKAVVRAEKAFLSVRPRIKPGVSERGIALRIEEHLKRQGCRSLPFDIIVASGAHSSMPHAKPTERKIEKGDFVIIDWGGEADGYYSDMTRTLLMNGRDLSEKIRIYNTVNDARNKAIASVREGIQTKEIDGFARSVIKDAGYGDFFGHGTGHGVGLDVHEYPHVSWTGGEKAANGMVFTIEPGIYVPELGGVRIEDMVTIKNGKGMLLTSLSRELEIIK